MFISLRMKWHRHWGKWHAFRYHYCDYPEWILRWHSKKRFEHQKKWCDLYNRTKKD
jgi:hypothetical protein